MSAPLLKVSAPPHTGVRENPSTVMADVIIALMPALLAGVLFFGYRAFLVVAISVGSAVLFEYLWCRLFAKPVTIGDLSAVVSGLILGMSLPVSVPLWLPAAGAFFMIVIAKMCFGGLGQNFVNPAMAGRAFLLASFPAAMTVFTQPFAKLPLGQMPDALTSATPLGGGDWTAASLLLGNISGCIGETSALALLIGAAYLLIRRIISLRIPLAYLATAGLLGWVFGGEGFFCGDALFHLLSGALLFGAFFIATDYTTSPITPMGQILYGIGCGVLTMVIRLAGGYPEGVSYAVLMMNVLTPLLEKCTAPRRYGVKRMKGGFGRWQKG